MPPRSATVYVNPSSPECFHNRALVLMEIVPKTSLCSIVSPTLPSPRNRKRQLPLQEQFGDSRQTHKGESTEPDERLTPNKRASSQWRPRVKSRRKSTPIRHCATFSAACSLWLPTALWFGRSSAAAWTIANAASNGTSRGACGYLALRGRQRLHGVRGQFVVGQFI